MNKEYPKECYNGNRLFIHIKLFISWDKPILMAFLEEYKSPRVLVETLAPLLGQAIKSLLNSEKQH